MTQPRQDALILLLVSVLVLGPAHEAQATMVPPQGGLPPAVFKPLQDALQKSYLDLFEEAPKLEFSASQVARMREYLKAARESCVKRFEKRAADREKELRGIQDDLKRKTARLSESERHDLHCQIQNLRTLKSQDEILAKNAIPVAYENRQAKLELIEKWPGQLKQIEQEIQSGAYHNRRYGDVKDIGFREIAAGQEQDVKMGQDAITQMKQAGLLPPEVKDETVRSYVSRLAEKIAARSDLRVPVKVTVLDSKEINAFALPGGFLFVQRGLLEATDDEAQLAGVIAHEIAHAADRHSRKLMKKATIAGIIFQAAQIAALVLTGGVAGIGTYYALQYGFYGLGLVLSLELLGVSREFELVADQLGIQYAWNAGYDPTGFIRFFDKLATREGYVNGLSWFRTHPPFYQRMVESQREIKFLPKKDGLLVQTEDFRQMKEALKSVTAQAEDEEKGRPSLLAPEAGCPAPQKIEYEPGQPIEALCESPR